MPSSRNARDSHAGGRPQHRSAPPTAHASAGDPGDGWRAPPNPLPTRLTPLPVDRSSVARRRAEAVPVAAADRRDVAWVPTDQAMVTDLLRLAALAPDDVIYDLGCGDGRIVIEAAREYGVRGVGVDIDPARIDQSIANAKKAGVEHLVRFERKSFFDVDVSAASVVALYLLPGINARLRPRLLSQLRPGSRIVSNHFDCGDWAPDVTVPVGSRRLLKWIVPAWVGGHWSCQINAPGRRRRLLLDLERRYQIVLGQATLGGRGVPVCDGRIAADQLSFRLTDWCDGGRTLRFTGTVEGRTLRGLCAPADSGEAWEWGGTRAESESTGAPRA